MTFAEHFEAQKVRSDDQKFQLEYAKREAKIKSARIRTQMIMAENATPDDVSYPSARMGLSLSLAEKQEIKECFVQVHIEAHQRAMNEIDKILGLETISEPTHGPTASDVQTVIATVI